ncbi:MAG: methylmalonyl-CoA epimerase [Saprospiraceae bacterium]
MQLEHIGIAVKSLDRSDNLFTRLLGREPYKHEAVAREGVTTSFFAAGGPKVELLEADREDSPIAKFIAKRGEGIHHLAFGVTDILAEMERLREAGFELLSDTPKPGADGKLIVFLHPRTTNGVLVELCQDAEEK